MKLMWLRPYSSRGEEGTVIDNEMSMWPSQLNRNLSNCEKARKKGFRGFNGIRTRGLCVSAAVLSQLSYEDPYTGGWPIYWVHQPVKGMKHTMKWCELQEYKWNEYVTIAVNRNLSNCEKARKKGFRDFNGIRTRGLCVSAAVLYQPELWRPIHWRPANLLSDRYLDDLAHSYNTCLLCYPKVAEPWK